MGMLTEYETSCPVCGSNLDWDLYCQTCASQWMVIETNDDGTRERFALDELIDCAKREAAWRRREYPHWVANKRMKEKKAEQEIALMEAIAQKLETLKQ